MKNLITTITSYLGWSLLVCALVLYSYGIEQAIVKTLQGSILTFPPLLASTISSIQAILLTNLGIALGISIAKPQSNIGMAIQLRNTFSKTSFSSNPQPPLESKELVQLIAIAIFVLSMIACTVVWAAKDFETDSSACVPLIYETGKMFIGVVLAYLAAS